MLSTRVTSQNLNCCESIWYGSWQKAQQSYSLAWQRHLCIAYGRSWAIHSFPQKHLNVQIAHHWGRTGVSVSTQLASVTYGYEFSDLAEEKWLSKEWKPDVSQYTFTRTNNSWASESPSLTLDKFPFKWLFLRAECYNMDRTFKCLVQWTEARIIILKSMCSGKRYSW